MSKHHLCKKSSLLLLGCMTIFSACGGNSSSTKSQDSIKTEEAAPHAAGGTTLELYNLKAPVKEIKEWSISLSPQIADVILTDVYVYRFKPDSKVDSSVSYVVTYSGDTPIKTQKAGMSGTFDIGYENGLPTRFTLDKEDSKKNVGEDVSDVFEEYTIAYDSNGIPKSLTGKTMPFFEGGKRIEGYEYTETYSDYEYDDKGNWVKRKVTTPSDTLYQYRCYVY